jgi:hypothetical protein
VKLVAADLAIRSSCGHAMTSAIVSIVSGNQVTCQRLLRHIRTIEIVLVVVKQCDPIPYDHIVRGVVLLRAL